MLQRCRRNCNCFAKDNYDNCHILNNTYFRAKCPFAKSLEQVRKELKFCADRLGYKYDSYELMLKEVYDVYLYRKIFKVGDDLE